MIKFRNATTIHLPRDNKANCLIYEHNGQYYIKANKPDTSVFSPLFYDNIEYSEVKLINEHWFLK